MVFHILKIICLNIYELILFFIYTFINNVVINLYAIIVAIYENVIISLDIWKAIILIHFFYLSL